MTSHTGSQGEDKNWSLFIGTDHGVMMEQQGSTNVYMDNCWALSPCKNQGDITNLWKTSSTHRLFILWNAILSLLIWETGNLWTLGCSLTGFLSLLDVVETFAPEGQEGSWQSVMGLSPALLAVELLHWHKERWTEGSCGQTHEPEATAGLNLVTSSQGSQGYHDLGGFGNGGNKSVCLGRESNGKEVKLFIKCLGLLYFNFGLFW